MLKRFIFRIQFVDSSSVCTYPDFVLYRIFVQAEYGIFTQPFVVSQNDSRIGFHRDFPDIDEAAPVASGPHILVVRVFMQAQDGIDRKRMLVSRYVFQHGYLSRFRIKDVDPSSVRSHPYQSVAYGNV